MNGADEQDYIPEHLFQDKIRKLEDYLDDVMKKRLTDAQAVATTHKNRLNELRNLLQWLRRLVTADVKEVDTLVDLGCEVFAHAHIPELRTVNVALILGFYLEMSLSEAISLLKNKIEIEEQRHQRAVYRVAYAKTEVRVFMKGLSTILEAGEE